MIETVFSANVNFIQKILLIIFLVMMSFYHLWSNSWKLQKLKGSDDDNLMSEFFVKIKFVLSWLILFLFPIFLSFLDYNISFYYFFTLIIGIYTGLILLFFGGWAYSNSKKLWEKIEGWF